MNREMKRCVVGVDDVRRLGRGGVGSLERLTTFIEKNNVRSERRNGPYRGLIVPL